jgi:hypothetical protein
MHIVMEIRNNKKYLFFFFFVIGFFPFFFVPILLSEKKGTYSIRDYFVSDSHLFNGWIGVYSGSESWGVLPDHFYKLKAPIRILFILCILQKWPSLSFGFG